MARRAREFYFRGFHCQRGNAVKCATLDLAATFATEKKKKQKQTDKNERKNARESVDDGAGLLLLTVERHENNNGTIYSTGRTAIIIAIISHFQHCKII